MLQVTADVFSGRPNPSWIIEDEREVREILREIAGNRSAIATESPPGEVGLGFRGLLVEPLNDELTRDFALPASFRLPVATLQAGGKASEIAERLLGVMGRSVPGPAIEAMPEALGEDMQTFLMGQISIGSRASAQDTAGAATEAQVSPEVGTAEAVAGVSCTIELGAYNPGFWNNDPIVRTRNNCYHYASNKRRDTFRILPGGGQPGAGCGHMYTTINCAEVSRAALCDGLHRRFDCFPDSEKPRYLVALVIWPPNQDFHWYRKHKEGFWGHKPGSTAARNTDNSGRVVTNPETCDRGPYTQFCGYFYTCKSQKIK